MTNQLCLVFETNKITREVRNFHQVRKLVQKFSLTPKIFFIKSANEKLKPRLSRYDFFIKSENSHAKFLHILSTTGDR